MLAPYASVNVSINSLQMGTIGFKSGLKPWQHDFLVSIVFSTSSTLKYGRGGGGCIVFELLAALAPLATLLALP